MNWQTTSGRKALKAEEVFYTALQESLNSIYPNQFKVIKHPSTFSDIYSKYKLSKDILKQIYNVNVSETNKNGKPKYNWGIVADFAIQNLNNKKTIFGEIKRQDGWVENTDPSAGRGNAHERCCKYFTPGLLNELRKKSKLETDTILPFWIVFVGDITRDPKRNREIAFWFQKYTSNYFMWRDAPKHESLLLFFENNLLKYLL